MGEGFVQVSFVVALVALLPFVGVTIVGLDVEWFTQSENTLEPDVAADKAAKTRRLDRFLRDALGIEPHRGGGQRVAVPHTNDHPSMVCQRRHPRRPAK